MYAFKNLGLFPAKSTFVDLSFLCSLDAPVGSLRVEHVPTISLDY